MNKKSPARLTYLTIYLPIVVVAVVVVVAVFTPFMIK